MTLEIAHGRARTVWGALLGVTAALALSASVAVAAPGNDGTVKIHDGSGEPAPEIKNEPHVGCPFHLHFFFADGGQSGDWWIESWPPTGDMTAVITGTYTTDSNGEAWIGPLSLDPGHYKLFWDGDTTPGGQTPLKHKAFWVTEPCEEGGPSEGGEPTPFQGATGNGPTSGGNGGTTFALLIGAGTAAATLLFLRPVGRRVDRD